MSASAGDRLGPYELVSRIGAGGMGEVWRARDTRLDRNVAVKILPAEFAKSTHLRIRFEREARTISQLDHPHICALFDVGENYLVMELLEGESLADRLARGPLPLAEVTRYGAQIADALDRAHRAGVIHRDLKPGNVVVTRSGAKLLDFGLAKSAASGVLADDATQHKPLTSEGTIVGTFQYMAPEQLDGVEADARTDIFALGAVLYEMTTGRRAFEGKTRTSLIAAIVAGNPRPVSELQPLTPHALEHVIAKCLSKDRDDRWQSAHDIAEELRWIGSGGSQSGAARVAMQRRAPRERLAWIAALLLCIAAAVWMSTRLRPAGELMEVAITTEENQGVEYLAGPPALSPDGKWLAYAARQRHGPMRLWLRSLERGPARAIDGTEGARSPFWSPDARFVGFTIGNGTLKKIPVGGGQTETLATSTFGGWTWNRDGVILHVSLLPDSTVHRVAASGGASAVVVRGSAIGATLLAWPSFLPDGNRFIFLARGGKIAERGQAGIWLATLDGSEKPRFLTAADTNALFVEPGHILFGQGGALRALTFDPKNPQPRSEVSTIAPVQTYDFAAMFSASSTGLLLYQPAGAEPRSELVLMNRKGEKIRSFGSPAFYWAPSLSPDGRRVAVDRSDATASGDVWIIDADGSTRVTFDSRNESAPVWSPDGQELAYSMDTRPGAVGVLGKRFGEAARPLLVDDGLLVVTTDWSPDGHHLALDQTTPSHLDAVVWSIADRKWIPIATTPANEGKLNFSPDGGWVVYQSDESGRFEIYAQPFPPNETKYQVTVNGGLTPRWLKTGEITWVDYENRLHAAKVETQPAFRVGAPAALFAIDQKHSLSFEYDATPEGNFLVTAALPAPPKPLTLLINWHRTVSP